MASNAVDRAKALMKQRRFSLAITLLESRSEFYENDFNYYVTLGKACLYAGDFGSAASYYGRAREIRLTHVELILGQAAIFLHRGDTERAVEYYLDALDNDPSNAVAKNALEFIRQYGNDYSTICKWADSGKLERFYPPLGMNPLIILRCVFFGLVAGITAAFFVLNYGYHTSYGNGPRGNIEQFELSAAEMDSPRSLEMSGTRILAFLTDTQIREANQKALMYYQGFKDNAAQIEVNRLLASDVSLSIRHKLHGLEEKLNTDTDFIKLKENGDNIDYGTVISGDHYLYENCVVSWRGRASLSDIPSADGSEHYIFNVGYENLQRILGQHEIVFKTPIQPPLDITKPVEFLVRIHFTPDDVLYLEGLQYHQPLEGKFKD